MYFLENTASGVLQAEAADELFKQVVSDAISYAVTLFHDVYPKRGRVPLVEGRVTTPPLSVQPALAAMENTEHHVTNTNEDTALLESPAACRSSCGQSYLVYW